MTQLRMDHPPILATVGPFFRDIHFRLYSIYRSLSSVGKTGLVSAHTADCGNGVRWGYEVTERMPLQSQISATGTLSKNQYIVKRGQIWPHRFSQRDE